ncbi:MAG: hypothetical protein JW976_07000 [Syntrophaceae bacterium]|nr:hypothetical protein [Syntrophaceae bacterium]
MKTLQTFSALKYPNDRLWFAGQLISLFGTWMQITAQSFLVFELTHSPAWTVTILGGDAATNGLMHSARRAGAVLGALLIASLGQFTFKGKLL